ncbi:hypothetical protein KIPB_009431, partial [Kipferlia bialata]|eukprot:g9431.t1
MTKERNMFTVVFFYLLFGCSLACTTVSLVLPWKAIVSIDEDGPVFATFPPLIIGDRRVVHPGLGVVILLCYTAVFVFFVLSCTIDPGTITPDNHPFPDERICYPDVQQEKEKKTSRHGRRERPGKKAKKKAAPAPATKTETEIQTVGDRDTIEFLRHDGILYPHPKECRTCKFIRPARSKHCAMCNRCVTELDHHCIWLNSDVGPGNRFFFLGFLLSLCFGMSAIGYTSAK